MIEEQQSCMSNAPIHMKQYTAFTPETRKGQEKDKPLNTDPSQTSTSTVWDRIGAGGQNWGSRIGLTRERVLVVIKEQFVITQWRHSNTDLTQIIQIL